MSDDGMFSLEIPQGALDEDLDITVERVECDNDDAVAPCYEVGPRGAVFLFPALVTYEVGDMGLDSDEAVTLAVVAEKEDGWSVLADREVDTEDEIVSASATYLSSFALVPVE